MAKSGLGASVHNKIKKHTSQGGKRVKTASMNKSSKLTYKRYRGQGR